MPLVESLEYLNQNSLRSYPIREGLAATDATGQFIIPDDFIVDFSLAASNTVSDRFYVSSIFNKITSFVVEISDQNAVVVGTFTITAGTFEENTTYSMQTSAGIYLIANGRLTIGSLVGITNAPSGLYKFDLTTTELEPKTIIPSLQGVNSVTFVDNRGISNTLSGNVNIIARSNLRFTYDSPTNTLTVDAGDGLGLNTLCNTPSYVTSINGVVPDENGNISLIGLGCSGITTTAPSTLKVNDTCCTPCSGCDDLAQLTDRLTQLESKYLDIKNYYQFLNNQLNNYLSTVNSNCVCPS